MANASPGGGARGKRLVLLVNTIAPYRLPLYEALGAAFDTTIVMSGVESNRQEWRGVDSMVRNCRVVRSATLTITRQVRRGEKLYDTRYTHIDFGCLWKLVSLRPAAVISIEMGFRSLCAILYGRITRTPVWIWSGVTAASESEVSTWRRLVRKLFSLAAPRWITYGTQATEYLLGLGVERQRILQSQNAVPHQEETRIAAILTPVARPIILCVGQLIARKGIEQLLQAISDVQKEGYVFTSAFVGDGPNRQAYERLAAERGLRNVVFVGAVPPAEVGEYYRAANALIFPTLADIWGLVVNEALLAGLPVLGSQYAGASVELLPPENRFDPLNPASIRTALKRAVIGEIPPADASRLKTIASVAQEIIDDVTARTAESVSSP